MEEDMQTAFRRRAIEAYRNDPRFHARVSAIVARVLHDHGPVDPERADREARDIAVDVAAQVLQAIYEGDAEIASLKHERDAYKKFAEESAGIRPMPPIIMARDAPPKRATGGDIPGSLIIRQTGVKG